MIGCDRVCVLSAQVICKKIGRTPHIIGRLLFAYCSSFSRRCSATLASACDSPSRTGPTNAIHTCSASWANAFSCGFSILHGDLLRVLHLALGLTFYTICLSHDSVILCKKLSARSAKIMVEGHVRVPSRCRIAGRNARIICIVPYSLAKNCRSVMSMRLESIF